MPINMDFTMVWKGEPKWQQNRKTRATVVADLGTLSLTPPQKHPPRNRKIHRKEKRLNEHNSQYQRQVC